MRTIIAWLLSYTHYKKKRGYPNVFKTAGIGSKCLFRCFFSRRFKLLDSEYGYRVAGPVPVLFKSARKGIHPIPALSKVLV